MTPRTLRTLLVPLALCAAAGGWAQTESSPTSGETAITTPPPGPRLLVPEPMFDAGKITAGTVVRHAYTFRNPGTAPLAVLALVSSCDCTTVETPPAPVAPGQAGNLVVRFDSTGFTGEIIQSVAVATNDPLQPQTVLTLRAMVANLVDLSPAQVVFASRTDTVTTETKVIRITNHTADPLILSPPDSSSPVFGAELTTMRPGQEFELRVTRAPSVGAGTTRGTITIQTNSAQVPTLTVQAVALGRIVETRKSGSAQGNANPEPCR